MGCGQSRERDLDGDPQPKKKGLDSFLCKKRPKNLIVFVLGGPGSGKGTQCEKIVKDYGFVHLSVGDLLRNEVNNDSDIGKQAKTCMAEGKLVPVETTLELLKNAMEKSSNKKFLIDGFPRSVDQAKAFEDKICSPNMVLYLECSPEVMEKRLLERGATSGRIDDNIETIKKRFKTFEEETIPVTKYYENSGKGVLVKISSESEVDVVYEEVKKALKNI
ncbi:hypothetical protein SUGI_0451400 [Cryptomeria japonica]|uniref:uncharacterized protein LOC131077987 n=1 Tax=Cryptomeria japonica TaxID=3369 RepID=UPI002408D442|nr:uncharacterized protein LOC131077987 [Cryptomeria japonica]GLJ23791.1 hypothetical protein SUGI_0451400 [Cryptomeria japonica]